ncbi:unnamed protein product [Auanema sp. JU1783]|nr:unnamed protein product [Auanema sp. JU1783]
MLYHLFVHPYRQVLNPSYKLRPRASSILRSYLRHRSYPSWTSYFIQYRSIQDDDYGQKHFNFKVDGHNYHILRVGCYPYIKYHCTKRPHQDLSLENNLYKLITLINLGFPCILYGIAATGLIRHTETVIDQQTGAEVPIHFLIKEDHN